MLNAMSQGRSGSMCTIHSDSSAGVFRRIASYAVQAPERLPLEATNLLVAGAVHFVVFLDIEHPTVADDDGYDGVYAQVPSGWQASDTAADVGGCDSTADTAAWFAGPLRRQRFVSSVREIVDAEGPQVISNEIFPRPGRGPHAEVGAPLRPETFRDLVRDTGYEPVIDQESAEGVWA